MPPTVMSHAAPAAIPRAPAAREACFVVGQDGEGHWVAVETHGLAGGLFRSRQDAIHYAAGETQRRPGAVVLTAERVAFRL